MTYRKLTDRELELLLTTVQRALYELRGELQPGKVITIQYVEEVVKQIAEAARGSDFERAHSLEDALYEDVLQWIAERPCPKCTAALLAEHALRAQQVEFERYCG